MTAKRNTNAKSELQKAADRVREMQVAVENSEAALKVCEKDYGQLQLKMAEANRNLQDTRGLLYAQREKLSRELSSVIDLAHGSSKISDKLSYAQCEVSNKY